MPLRHDHQLRQRGTRFLLYPQAPRMGGHWRPETVWLSPPAGTVGAGPADQRIVVRDAIAKRRPYESPAFAPPYRGPTYPPARPGPGGHFDHLAIGTHQFEAAHMYAGIRRVLDIWEGYLGRPIRWHFAADHARLELIPFIPWGNAHAGYGFIETGFGQARDGSRSRFCLNFDVLAHEIGHTILLALLGTPRAGSASADFLGFNESAGDLIALVAVLHFDSVLDHLMATTCGNLYTLNELSRLAELSATDQIRVAVNDVKMSDFAHGWTSEHAISLPLTGALFDVMIEVYLKRLVRERAIGHGLARASLTVPRYRERAGAIQRAFARAYRGREASFRAALVEARDYLGHALALTWENLSLSDLGYAVVGDRFLAADRALTRGRHRRTIARCLRWRQIGQIGLGPRGGTGGHTADPRRSGRILGRSNSQEWWR